MVATRLPPTMTGGETMTPAPAPVLALAVPAVANVNGTDPEAMLTQIVPDTAPAADSAMTIGLGPPVVDWVICSAGLFAVTVVAPEAKTVASDGTAAELAVGT